MAKGGVVLGFPKKQCGSCVKQDCGCRACMGVGKRRRTSCRKCGYDARTECKGYMDKLPENVVEEPVKTEERSSAEQDAIARATGL